MQSTESVIVLDENTNMVISKVFVCAVRYYYDTEDGLTKKHIKFADGKEFTENYEKTENDIKIEFPSKRRFERRPVFVRKSFGCDL